MAKLFINFKDKKRIYNRNKLISRRVCRKRIKIIKKKTYQRFNEILNTRKKVKFTDNDIERISIILDNIVEELIQIVVKINKDRSATMKKTLKATDIQCAIKWHSFLSSP